MPRWPVLLEPERRRRRPSYVESYQCEHCKKDYLYPAYGGKRHCHNCSMNDETGGYYKWPRPKDPPREGD